MSQVDILRLREGSRPILFADHGSGGVLAYGKLARHLNSDQPFYVVKANALDDVNHPFKDIYDLVEQYVASMLEICPDGPFMICGRESFILTEVGQQLLSRHKPVPLTIVFDTAPPTRASRRKKKTRGKNPITVRQFASRWYRHLRQILSTHLSSPSNPVKQQQSIAQAYAENYRSDPDSPNRINARLTANYVWRQYHAKVVYMQSKAYRQDLKKANHIQRWKAIADEVDVHETPGSHSSMYDKPQVQVLAHLVQAECDKVAGTLSPRRED